MIATAYKCDHLQNDTIAFDPFEILEIPAVCVILMFKNSFSFLITNNKNFNTRTHLKNLSFILILLSFFEKTKLEFINRRNQKSIS